MLLIQAQVISFRKFFFIHLLSFLFQQKLLLQVFYKLLLHLLIYHCHFIVSPFILYEHILIKIFSLIQK